MPGRAFTPGVEDPSSQLRVSFSIVPFDKVEKGLSWLLDSVLEAFVEAQLPLTPDDLQNNIQASLFSESPCSAPRCRWLLVSRSDFDCIRSPPARFLKSVASHLASRHSAPSSTPQELGLLAVGLTLGDLP